MAKKKYSIEVSKTFIKDFKKIPKAFHKIINSKIAELETNPYIGKKLVGNLKDIWRIRIGTYRVAYSIHDGKLVVLLLKAGHRKDFYNNLERLY